MKISQVILIEKYLKTSYYFNEKNRQAKLMQLFLWIAIVTCLSIILYLIFFGQYIRPFQDDFYYYPPVNHDELVALLNERYHWTGRLTTTTIHLLVGWSGMFWIVPLVSFGLLISGVYAFSRVLLGKFFVMTRGGYRRVSWFLAVGLTLAIFLVTPSPYSSMFWLSAAPIHMWSYALILLYIAYILKCLFQQKYKLKISDYFLMTITPLVVGMMGEVAMFTLTAFTGLILVYAGMHRSKKIALTAILNFLGLGIAFYALFFSIGAVIRRGSEGSMSVSEVISQAPYVIVKNLYILASSLLNNRWVLVVLLLMAIVLGMNIAVRVITLRKTLIFTAIITLVCLVLMSLNFVGVYASVKLTVAWDRTQAFSVIIIIGLLMLYGLLIGAGIRQYFAKQYAKGWLQRMNSIAIGIGIMIVVLHIGFLPYVQQFATGLRERAIAYDKREAYLLHRAKSNSNDCPIVVPSTSILGMQEGVDLLSDENHALNVGVRRYYRLPCTAAASN